MVTAFFADVVFLILSNSRGNSIKFLLSLQGQKGILFEHCALIKLIVLF